jgi:hypothetical protein
MVQGVADPIGLLPHSHFLLQKLIMEKSKIRKLQVLKFNVKKGETHEFNGNTKTEHDLVVGVFFRLSNPDALQGATIRAWIDDTEIIPDDAEVALFHHNDRLSIGDVAFPVYQKAKNSPIRIIYKDDSQNLAVDDSYFVRGYLLCVINEKMDSKAGKP